MTSNDFITKFVELWYDYQKQNKKTDEPTECAYIVALHVGGTMDTDGWHYHDFDIICATSPSEASRKYDEKHNCTYFYGRTICRIDDIIIPNNAMLDAIYQNMRLHEENTKLLKMIGSLKCELLGEWYPNGGSNVNETKEIFDKIIEIYKKDERSNNIGFKY